MIKSLIKDTLIYSIPTIVSRGIGIFLLPIYTRITSPDQLGALELFIAFSTIISITVALEITQGISRFLPESDQGLRGSYATTGLAFSTFMYVISIFLMYIFAEYLSVFITGSNQYLTEFYLILIYIFFNSYYYYFQNILRFEGKSTQYSISSVTYALINIVIVFLLGVVLDYSLQAILISLILSSFFGSFLGLFFLRNSFALNFSFNLLKKLLAFSIPLVPASVFIFISLYIDRFMINHFLGLEQVGIYSIGTKISSATGLILIGFQMAITPLVYKNYHLERTRNDLSIIFKYFTAFALIFFLSFSLLANEILLLLTTDYFLIAAPLIPILVLSFLFSHMYVFMPGIAIKKKTYLILIFNFLVVLINVLLNYILIPKQGIFGASLATCCANLFGFFCYVYFSQKLYYVQHNWYRYCTVFLISLVMLYCAFNYIDSLDTHILYLSKLLLLTTFIAVLFLFKILSIDEFLSFKSIIFKKTQ